MDSPKGGLNIGILLYFNNRSIKFCLFVCEYYIPTGAKGSQFKIASERMGKTGIECILSKQLRIKHGLQMDPRGV